MKQMTIIILFFPFLLIGQESIDGGYVNKIMGELNRKVDAEHIIFHSNNTFSYECSFFEYQYGKGRYSLNEDSLILSFENWQKRNNETSALADFVFVRGSVPFSTL